MKTFHYIVKGMVQHVGYRFYVGMRARKLEVSGKVRNLDNGAVEVFVQSDDFKKIDEMEKIIYKGSPFGHVDEVIRDIKDMEEMDDFQMIYWLSFILWLKVILYRKCIFKEEGYYEI